MARAQPGLQPWVPLGLWAEAQGAFLPLVPHFDTLLWLDITLALGGIAVAVRTRVDVTAAMPKV